MHLHLPSVSLPSSKRISKHAKDNPSLDTCRSTLAKFQDGYASFLSATTGKELKDRCSNFTKLFAEEGIHSDPAWTRSVCRHARYVMTGADVMHGAAARTVGSMAIYQGILPQPHSPRSPEFAVRCSVLTQLLPRPGCLQEGAQQGDCKQVAFHLLYYDFAMRCPVLTDVMPLLGAVLRAIGRRGCSACGHVILCWLHPPYRPMHSLRGPRY